MFANQLTRRPAILDILNTGSTIYSQTNIKKMDLYIYSSSKTTAQLETLFFDAENQAFDCNSVTER